KYIRFVSTLYPRPRISCVEKMFASGMTPMPYPFKFNRAAALEAILYLAANSRDATLHRVFKLLYFAEKQHLEKYGRMITGDAYKAMEYGPVPSKSYDLTKMAR